MEQSRRSNAKQKEVLVEFLYLDRKTCSRCKSTDSTLEEAAAELSGVLNTLGYRLTVNKIQITSAELAEQYRFFSSPTIRVNGWDICTDIRENACKDCGDLCGDDVDCRVFVYEGVDYEQPPKAMIIDGILKALYGPRPLKRRESYKLPENLNGFFRGRANRCCNTAGCCTRCGE